MLIEELVLELSFKKENIMLSDFRNVLYCLKFLLFFLSFFDVFVVVIFWDDVEVYYLVGIVVRVCFFKVNMFFFGRI